MSDFLRGIRIGAIAGVPSFMMVLGGMFIGYGATRHTWIAVASGVLCAGIWAYITIKDNLDRLR